MKSIFEHRWSDFKEKKITADCLTIMITIITITLVNCFSVRCVSRGRTSRAEKGEAWERWEGE